MDTSVNGEVSLLLKSNAKESLCPPSRKGEGLNISNEHKREGTLSIRNQNTGTVTFFPLYFGTSQRKD